MAAAAAARAETSIANHLWIGRSERRKSVVHADDAPRDTTQDTLYQITGMIAKPPFKAQHLTSA